MTTPELLDFIKNSLAAGSSPDQIRNSLISAGWNETDINDAFKQVSQPTASPPQTIQAPEAQITPTTTYTPAGLNQYNKPLPQKNRTPRVTAIIALLLVILGGAALAYKYNLLAFLSTSRNATGGPLSKVFERIGDIESASYAMTFSIESQERETGAQPYVPAPDDSAKPRWPAFIEFVSEDNFLSFLPGNLNIVLKTSGTTQKQSTDATDARLQLGADINFEDFIINADVEFLKKGVTYFAKVNKFPGLFFDISKIKQKWVRIIPEDIANSGADLSNFDIVNTFLAPPTTGRQKNNIKPLEQFQLFSQLAESEGAFSIDPPKLEKLNNSQMYHYILKLHPEKIAPFYKRFTEEAKNRFGAEAFMQFDEAMFQYLQSGEFKMALDYISAHTNIETWVDTKSGFPTKVQYGFRFVPSAKNKKLKDKQLYVSANITLSDINKKISIEEPKDFTTFEDAVIAVSGISREEYIFGKQVQNIRQIRSAIDRFKQASGKYPNSLEELKKNKNENMPFLKNIPLDAYSKKPFNYAIQGADYMLAYTINLPPYETGSIPSYSIRYSSPNNKVKYSLAYIQGSNTASSKSLSEEALRAGSIDTDGDSVSDSFEIYIGSNKNKRNTDGDGVDDGTELQRDSNPLGPGKLKYNNSGGFLF